MTAMLMTLAPSRPFRHHRLPALARLSTPKPKAKTAVTSGGGFFL
jgi:hypothetical protein